MPLLGRSGNDKPARWPNGAALKGIKKNKPKPEHSAMVVSKGGVEERQQLHRQAPPLIIEPADAEVDLDDDDLIRDVQNDLCDGRRDPLHLTVEGGPGGGLRKSASLTSITSRVRARARRIRNNQCAGIVFFLLMGLLCSVCSYLTSVWSAQLNKELIETAVKNEQTLRFKLKKSLAEGPSKYLIGLLNFGGRLLSAIGTVMLVQVVVSYVKRRRYNLILRSAAGEADQVVEGVHTGITDAAGEMIMNCIQALLDMAANSCASHAASMNRGGGVWMLERKEKSRS